jgi:hypothetical protein
MLRIKRKRADIYGFPEKYLSGVGQQKQKSSKLQFGLGPKYLSGKP